MCRSGCRSRNHKTWGECARAAHIAVDYPSRVDARKAWDSELSEYAKVRRQGVQPESTKRKHIEQAKLEAGL